MATLQVINIPHFISQDEFSRLFLQLAGCLGCRMLKTESGTNLGYVEFCDPQAADNARAIYNGWQGWDAKGLLIETCAPADKRLPLKRDRESDMQAGPFKQMRTDGNGLGGYGGGAPVADLRATAPQGMLQAAAGQGMVRQATDGGYGTIAAPSSQLQGGGSYVPQQQLSAGGYAPQQQQQQQAPVQQAQAAGGGAGLGSGYAPQAQPGGAGGYAPQQAQAPGVGGYAQQPQGLVGGTLSGTLSAQSAGYGAKQPQAGYAQAPAGGGAYVPQPMGAQAGGGQPQGAPQTGLGLGGGAPEGGYGQMGGGAYRSATAPEGPGAPQYGQDSQYGVPRQVSAPQAAAPAPAGAQYGVLRGDYGAAPAQAPLGPGQPPLQPPPLQPPTLQPPMQAPAPQPLPAPGQGYAEAGPPAQWGTSQAYPGAQGYPGAGPSADPAYPGPQLARPGHDDRMGGPGGYPGGPEGGYHRSGPPPEEESFAPDACRTLYVDNLPGDATKREMAHIFRAFEGFQELRFVSKQDKSGRQVCIAFAQFTSTYFATRCLKMVQGYPMDLDSAETAIVRVSYARPPKSERGDPREREPRRAGPSGSRGSYDQGDPNGPYGGSERERGPGGSGGSYGGERGSSRPGARPSERSAGWYPERGAPEPRGGYAEGAQGGYRRPSGFSDGPERHGGGGGGGGPGRGGGRPSGFPERGAARREPNPRSPPARLPPPGDRRPRSNAQY